ncbi:MAG: N-formylglutamate amidohydrolase, partial [Sphingomonadaceae bacterium]|nr:N-formylglutamate amidohydrolase [Sphingomonadaceae bacterium]
MTRVDRAPSFERFGPARAATPVVVSVPHAGRDYPEALLAASRLALSSLRQLEDRYVDGLAAPLAGQGHAVVIARTARAWIDLN